MSNWLIFGLIFIGAYLLQSILTLRQIKAFNSNFQAFRQKGKVVTGKKSGRLIAGTVILLSIDDEGVVKDGTIMQGVSVFAKFKPFSTFNGEQLMDLNNEHPLVVSLHKFTKLAVEDARELYIRHLTGTLVQQSYSRVTPFGVNVSTALQKLKTRLFSGS